MSLSSLQLDAFYEVAKASSFSKAAKKLGITQSALSQRVKNLEEELGTTLLIRAHSGLQLTLAGEELVQLCKNRSALEDECLARIRQPKSATLSGVVRIGGYSTVMRSLVLPALSPILTKNPDVRIEILTREMRELPALLRSGETDFIVLDQPLAKDGIETRLLGHEENVLIESKAVAHRGGIFLDHDAEDQTTLRFFGAQGKKHSKLKRAFLDEIYAIIDGVALGFGKAVVPRHLLQSETRVRVVQSYKPLLVPVYLNFYQQPFYSRLQEAVLKQLTTGIEGRLARGR